MQYGATADETDTRDNLGGDARVIAREIDRQTLRQQREHGRTEANEHDGAQTRGPMLEFALQSYGAAQNRGHGQSQQTGGSAAGNRPPTLKQMNMTVRKPVGRCLSSRSSPMAPPRIAATVSLSKLEEAPLEIGHQLGSQATSS